MEVLINAKTSATEESQRERTEHKRAIAKKLHEASLKQAAIPPRFQTKTFADLESQNQMHAGIIQWVEVYRDNFAKNCEEGRNVAFGGNPGTGKTHLACALANDLIKRGRQVAFITVSGFFVKLRASYRDGSEMQYLDTLANLDLLIIDEVGAHVQKDMETAKSSMFDLINTRYNNLKPTLFVGNVQADEMAGYFGERMYRRLMESGGAFLPFTWGRYQQAASPLQAVKPLGVQDV